MWLTFGVAKRIVSSAKWRLDMVRFELGSLMPTKRFWEVASLIIRLKTSVTRTKSRGESGSPWRNPRVDFINPPETPLIEMEE
jgi:hypothetical protein